MASAKTNRIFTATTLILLVPHFVFAQIVITEIMYDLPVGSDSGREWIEVYNSAAVAVDLTKFKLFENGTNHKIVGAGTLAPNTYAVIADNTAKFKTDWPGYPGLLFESAFDLGNTGDTLEIHNASSTLLDTAVFTSALGAAGDGNSLNRAPGAASFTPRTPSPGAHMSADAIQPKVKPVPEPKIVAPKKSPESATVTSPIKEDSPTSEDSSSADPSPQIAAVVTAATAPWHWWLAAGLLALSSAGAIVFARRYAKDEWDIVDESDS